MHGIDEIKKMNEEKYQEHESKISTLEKLQIALWYITEEIKKVLRDEVK